MTAVIPNVVQRGHNRRAVFIEETDYQYYLENLAEWKTTLGCKVYGYCLMTNHVHLIVDPGEQPENLGLLVKHLAGSNRFIDEVEECFGHRLEFRGQGRPVKRVKVVE